MSIPIYFILIASTGSSLSDQVLQTPSYIQANPGETAKISCSHSIQNYNVILWYKRSEGTQLQLLGYRFLSKTYPEPGVDVEMEGGADKGQICTLTIKKLNASRSAVYFCAASYHSAADPLMLNTKSSSVFFLFLSSHSPFAPVLFALKKRAKSH